MKISTKIALISFFAALSGMALELLGLVDFTPSDTQQMLILICRSLTPDLQLSFFKFFPDTLSYRNFESGLVLNYLSLTFYFWWLLGALAYVFSSQREVRLLRALSAVVLLSAAVKLLGVLLGVVLYLMSPAPVSGQFWLLLLIPLFNVPLWGGLALFVLKKLSAGRVLAKTEQPNSDQAPPSYVATPLGQRLVHALLDTAISIMVCGPFIFGIAQFFLRGLRDFVLSDRVIIYVIIFFARLMYYLFFELWWGATPAKFLTESRVLQGEGVKLTNRAGVIRFFSRYIPLSGFSYLGKDRGWPDELSDTWVVKEERTGTRLVNYSLVILITIVVGWASYSGYSGYSESVSRHRYQQQQQEELLLLEDDMNNLSKKDLIYLTKAKRNYDDQDDLYLKIEEVKGDDLTCKFFTFESSYSEIPNMVLEQHYLAKQDELLPFVLSKQALLDMVKNEGSMDILGDGVKYRFKKIFHLFGPHIKSRSAGGYGSGFLRLGMENVGWSVDLTKISNLEGDIVWENELPQKLKSGAGYFSGFNLVGKNYERGTHYKFTLTVQDSLGAQYQYLVEGVNADCEVRRLNINKK